MTLKCLRQTGIIAEGWNQIKLSSSRRAGVRCAGSLVSAEKHNVTSSAKICSGEEVIPNSCPGQNPHTKSHQEKHHFLFTLWKETIVSAHELSAPLPAASSTHKGSNSYQPPKAACTRRLPDFEMSFEKPDTALTGVTFPVPQDACCRASQQFNTQQGMNYGGSGKAHPIPHLAPGPHRPQEAHPNPSAGGNEVILAGRVAVKSILTTWKSKP